MSDDEAIETPEAPAKMAAESWAEKKQMLPQFIERAAFVGRLQSNSKALNPNYALFAMAKAHGGWPIGKELTEQEFDDAVAAAQSVQLR